jgi:hypothetical protein
MSSSDPGYGANAYGLGYYEMGFDDPDGPYYTTAPVYISAGPATGTGYGPDIPTGAGDLQGEGSGAFGAGFTGGPLYSYASLSTGSLYATADWNIQSYSITDLNPGPDYAEGEFYDTVTFQHVPAGATATFVLASSSFEVDTNGSVSEEIYADGYQTSQIATPTAITLQTSAGSTPETGWASSISVTFPIVSGVAYSVGANVVAQTYEPPAADYPPPGVVDGIAEIDPSWSVILPAGVTETTASGVPIPLACFAAGTRVRTLRGEVPVEALTVGDRVVTVGAGGNVPRRIVWLGHRRVDCRRHPNPVDVWPVRVRPGAFGDATPHRTLWLSPDHAVLVDDALIPIRYLVNDATIVQEVVESVSYWHVELARHDVILAEGLPCESYLDTGNRGAFANGGAAAQVAFAE